MKEFAVKEQEKKKENWLTGTIPLTHALAVSTSVLAVAFGLSVFGNMVQDERNDELTESNARLTKINAEMVKNTTAATDREERANQRLDAEINTLKALVGDFNAYSSSLEQENRLLNSLVKFSDKASPRVIQAPPSVMRFRSETEESEQRKKSAPQGQPQPFVTPRDSGSHFPFL